MLGQKKNDTYAGTNCSHWFMDVTKTGKGVLIEVSIPIAELQRMIAEAEVQNTKWEKNGVTGKEGTVIRKKNLRFKKTYAVSYFKVLAKKADTTLAKENKKAMLLQEYEANKDEFEAYRKTKSKDNVTAG